MFKISNNMLSSSYPILRSKILLYLATFLSVFYILMLGMAKEYVFIIIFILVSYLTTFFSKNMIVVLLLGLAVTNVVRLGKKATLSEGLDTMEGDKSSDDADEKAPGSSKPKTKAEPKATPKASPPTAASAMSSTTTDSANNLLNKLSTIMNTDGAGKGDMASLQLKADELVSTQDKLMKNMSQLGPLLEKAEGFLSKYEGLKDKLEGMKTELEVKAESLRNSKEGFTSGRDIQWK